MITKINRLEYTNVIRKAGIDRVISPKHIAADEAEIIEFMAFSDTRHLNVSILELPLKKDLLITAIVRGEHAIIPKGKNSIMEGDRVIIATTIKQIDDLNQIFNS